MESINQAFFKANDTITMRTGKTRHQGIQTQSKIIRHKTTLFAKIHRKTAGAVAVSLANRTPEQLRAVQRGLSKIMLRAAHNHVSAHQVKAEVTTFIKRAGVPAEY